MEVMFDAQGFRVNLTDLEKKLFERTLPVSKPFIEAQLNAVKNFLLMMIARGKHEIVPYFERAAAGEPLGQVVTDMVRDLGISIEALTGGVPPPTDEQIFEAFGWADNER